MTVYLDELFLLNAALNYLLLLGSARLGGGVIRHGRLALAAALGGVYAAAALWPPLAFFRALGMKAVALALMLLAAFGPARRTVRLGALFLALAFCLGGVTLLCVQLLGTGLLLLSSGAYYPVSMAGLLTLAGSLYLIAYVVFSHIAEHGGGEIVPVTLSLGAHSVQVRALRDTGNTLRDPITNERVLVTDWQTAASLLPEDVSRSASIVYTPLNGTGISCVPRCLRAHGFTNITIPPEQAEPDGAFPTCPYPNPEIREALSVGLRLAEETGSELLLATDPDCDRVGAAVKTAAGCRLITGNEMGVLLLDFVCRMRRANGTMPERPVAVKTIVTTPMAEKVAAHYGVELRNVLTGFKYIGEQIGLLEKDGEADRYIFGFEESYGYLSGSFVRDKDAVNASLLICEMFVWYKSQGKTLADALEALYAQYGFFEAKLLSFTFEGSAGFAHMTELLDSLRLLPPAELAGEAVRQVIDYDRDETGLPRSNVLRFILDGGEVVVRPSGTEPKLKIYLTAARESREKSRAMLALLEKRLTDWAK